MTLPLVPNHSSAVAELQKKWPKFDKPADRAEAVRDAHAAGVSFRALAKALNRSQTLLRQLKVAAEASKEDLDLARKGKITTRELVRRSKAATKHRIAEQQRAIELKRAKDAQKGSKLICKWLEEKGLSGAWGEDVVREARRILQEEHQKGTLPKPTLLSEGLTVAKIIAHCRHLKPDDLDPAEVWLYPDWLARWALEAFPDFKTCHASLSIALGVQIKYMPDQPKRRAQRKR